MEGAAFWHSKTLFCIKDYINRVIDCRKKAIWEKVTEKKVTVLGKKEKHKKIVTVLNFSFIRKLRIELLATHMSFYFGLGTHI